MSIFCSVGGHRPSEQRIRNAGHHFARCTRCGADLVEVDERWSTAPAGFRIIWKAARELEVLELEAELEAEAQLPSDEQCAPASDQEYPERRRIDRRVNRYAVAYTGIERRRSRDRRQSFGKKSASA